MDAIFLLTATNASAEGMSLLTAINIFILAGFVGYKVITNIPPLLHTPLMAATNAISAISVVGAIIAAGSGHDMVTNILGAVAVASAMMNVVGGFLITDRILKMFKKDKKEGAK